MTKVELGSKYSSRSIQIRSPRSLDIDFNPALSRFMNYKYVNRFYLEP
jgi:hypothetical protein